MAKFDYNDDSVVVIVGSGAGGGTLANELCQKGVKVVVLEAGKRQSSATFINDEWKSFGQLAWTDKRTTSGNWRVAKDFPELPAWICKTVGGTTTHWAGASLRFHEHEFKAKTTYGNVDNANLLDWPITLSDLEPYYTRAEDKMGVTRTNGIPGLPGNNNFKIMYDGAQKVGYKTCNTGHMAINSRARGPRALHATRLLLPGLQVGRKVVDALHRDPRSRSHRQSGPAPRIARDAHRDERGGKGERRGLPGRRWQPAAPARAGGVRRG
jgi:choline dehydrogenase-like flavoprotein